jgi:hypothetical protein
MNYKFSFFVSLSVFLSLFLSLSLSLFLSLFSLFLSPLSPLSHSLSFLPFSFLSLSLTPLSFFLSLFLYPFNRFAWGHSLAVAFVAVSLGDWLFVAGLWALVGCLLPFFLSFSSHISSWTLKRRETEPRNPISETVPFTNCSWNGGEGWKVYVLEQQRICHVAKTKDLYFKEQRPRPQFKVSGELLPNSSSLLLAKTEYYSRQPRRGESYPAAAATIWYSRRVAHSCRVSPT